MMFHKRSTRAKINQANDCKLDRVSKVSFVECGNQTRRTELDQQTGCKPEARQFAPISSQEHQLIDVTTNSSSQRRRIVCKLTKLDSDKLDCKRQNTRIDRRMISKRTTTTRTTSNTIYPTTNNLLLNVKATKYNRNISLMRSFLVNYLKLTLCSCYDTVSLATLLVFVLLLNNFIEAHQQNNNYQQQQQQQQQYQTTKRPLCGTRTCQLYWNKTSIGNNQDQAGGSMGATRSARARRSVENFVLSSPFDDGDQQQRPLLDLDDGPDEYPTGRAEILLPTGSELMPMIAIEHSPLSHDHYEISRLVTNSNLSSRPVQSLSALASSAHYHLAPKPMASNNRIRPLETGIGRTNTIRLDKPGQSLAKIRNKQGSHQLRQQQASSSQFPNAKLDQIDGMVAAAVSLVPDWSFRQAASDHKPEQATTSPTTITTTRRPTQSRNQELGRTQSSRPRLEIDENHWIPITRTIVNEIVVPASSQAASALLDYPTQLGRPLRYQAGRHHHNGHLSISATSMNHPPYSSTRRPGLHQLGTYAYGSRNPHIEMRPPHPGRPHPVPNYENHFEFDNHHHHHANDHHHHLPHHQQHQYPRHRRPRFQGELDNEIGPPSMPRPSKIYKRVLLCDKTLVSLDYIRNVDLEPRPSSQSLGGQLLNEHEINEINDNFLDLETNLDSSVSRLSSQSSSSPSTLVGSNSSNNNTRRRSPATNSTSTNGLVGQPAATTSATSTNSIDVERLVANETTTDQLTMRSGDHLMVERRFWRDSPLSDEDPLVRCDMWDLEKGLKSRKPPEGILRMAIKADFDTVRDAINRCRQLSEKTLPPDDEYRDGLEIMSTEDLISLFSMKRGLMPGTKWCGLGDQASTYNDLGPKHRIDICCRAHDHCPIRSKPFRNDYGVLNIGLYTKSHCDCDADFYRCLREVRSRTADMLGNLYFNVMKLQCMREERLKVCREMKPIALGFERCVRYEDSPVKTVFKFTTPPVAY